MIRSRYVFLQKGTFRSRYTPLNGQDNSKPFIRTRYIFGAVLVLDIGYPLQMPSSINLGILYAICKIWQLLMRSALPVILKFILQAKFHRTARTEKCWWSSWLYYQHGVQNQRVLQRCSQDSGKLQTDPKYQSRRQRYSSQFR